MSLCGGDVLRRGMKLQLLVAIVLTLAALYTYTPLSTSSPAERVSTTIIFFSPLPSSSPSSSSASASSSPSSAPSSPPSPSPSPACGDGWHSCSCLLTAAASKRAPCGVRHRVELAWGSACHTTPAAGTGADHKAKGKKSRKVVTHAFSEAEQSEQFTVVILSMAQRMAMLQQVLREYDGMPTIAEIIVVMNGLSEDHITSRLGVTKTPISFVNNSINSLNSRFAVADRVKTEAVLSNDDDLFYTPQSATYLFRIWQRHRRSIVGFSARFSAPKIYTTASSGLKCFNSVLSNAAFLSTDLLREYSKATGPAAQVRAHVDAHQNCEDIGINFVAAAAEPKMDPPVFVQIKPVLIVHKKGLSDSKDHYRERQACGKAFTGFFDGLRLPNSTHTYFLEGPPTSPSPSNFIATT